MFPYWGFSNSSEIDKFKRENLEKIRTIGNALNRAGGFGLMRYVGEKFKQHNPQNASILESMWDGIGSWRG
jgi:hypothetical protein